MILTMINLSAQLFGLGFVFFTPCFIVSERFVQDSHLLYVIMLWGEIRLVFFPTVRSLWLQCIITLRRGFLSSFCDT